MAQASRKPPICQAYALAKAMKQRPTPQLASRYFETLKRMLGDAPARGTPPDARLSGGLGADPAQNNNMTGPETAEGTACKVTTIQPQ